LAKPAKATSEQSAVSYIVRVYRCDARHIAGVVEIPMQARRTAFQSFAQLRAIILRESTAPSSDKGE